ncbi:MAG: XdhC/CoxI family protein [Bacteroidetes bacterium]|nr:XdhC/CoxI family protein [Bacteroidota bacterium]
MKNIFEHIVEYLSKYQNGMLATIVWTSGSTPAPAQSKMLLDMDGNRIAGTIGGGCVEEAVMRRTVASQDKQTATMLDFELNDDDAESGLICGGTLKVLLEKINSSEYEIFKTLAERCNNGLESVLITQILPDRRTHKTILDEKFSLLIGNQPDSSLNLIDVFKKYSPVIQNVGENTYIAEPIEGKAPLFIFGGGHVGKAVARFASQTGFNVTVVDDRIEYASKEKHPEADDIVCAPFRNINEVLNIGNSAYVVIVTRGHAYDELILEQVVQLKPKYIGMIGSKRKVLITYKKLIERGIDETDLKKVYAPVGLDIGAISAEEIAISIVAEMVRVRRKSEETNIVNYKKIW